MRCSWCFPRNRRQCYRVYTAITRARQRVAVLARPEVLEAAIGIRAKRDSALAERIRDPRPGATLAL